MRPHSVTKAARCAMRSRTWDVTTRWTSFIGNLVLQCVNTTQGFVFVFLSSRASYELVRKSARVGISMVATISAPTSLAIAIAIAIAIAKQAGLRLVSFARENSFVEYDVE